MIKDGICIGCNYRTMFSRLLASKDYLLLLASIDSRNSEKKNKQTCKLKMINMEEKLGKVIFDVWIICILNLERLITCIMIETK